MAYYFTSDGRVVDFDAEVNSEGHVRPKNYHDFNHDDTGGEDSFHSAEPAVTRRTHTNNNVTIDYDIYLERRKEQKDKQMQYAKSLKQKKNKEVVRQFRVALQECLDKTKISDASKSALKELFMPLNLVDPSSSKAIKFHCQLEKEESALFISSISKINKLLIKYKPKLAQKLSKLGKKKNNPKYKNAPLVLDNGSIKDK